MLQILMSALLASVLLVALIFCILFKIEKMPYSANCMKVITLVLHEIVKDEVIYTTELLSVDLDQKAATIRVKFPEEGWKEFKGREKEKFEGIGYYLDSMSENQINIIVNFPESGYHYRLHYRWK